MADFGIGEGLAIAAAAASAVTAVSAGQQAASADKFNQQVAQNNASQALQTAAANEADSKYRATFLLGKQRAAAAASGVDPNSGSPLDVMTETAQQTTLDALRTRYTGTTQAQGFTAQAGLSGFQAGNASTSGYLRAAGSLLNGAAIYAGRTTPYDNGGDGATLNGQSLR